MKEYSINLSYDWLDDECNLKSKQTLGGIIDACRIINDAQSLKFFDDYVKQCIKDFDKQQKQNIISKMKEDYKKEFKPYFNGTFKQFISSIDVFHPVYGNIPFQFTQQNLKIIKALEDNQNLFIGKYRQVGATTLLALHIIYKALTIEDYDVYLPIKRNNIGLLTMLKKIIKINPDLMWSKDRIMSCIEGNVGTYRNTIFTERIIDELDIQTYECLYENENPNVDFGRNIFTTSQLRLEDYFTSLGWKLKRLIMCG